MDPEILPLGFLVKSRLGHGFKTEIAANDTKYYASDGLEMIREIKSRNKQVQMIMLSGQEDVQVARKIIKEVDTNYVLKDNNGFKNVLEIIRKAYPDKV
jgi:DNA-binding NtrC family response regulator